MATHPANTRIARGNRFRVHALADGSWRIGFTTRLGYRDFPADPSTDAAFAENCHALAVVGRRSLSPGRYNNFGCSRHRRLALLTPEHRRQYRARMVTIRKVRITRR